MSYINFVEVEDSKRKTKQFYVRPVTEPIFILGYISFYPQWRKFVFHAINGGSVFDCGCLREIADFCEGKTKEWREDLKERKSIPIFNTVKEGEER